MRLKVRLGALKTYIHKLIAILKFAYLDFVMVFKAKATGSFCQKSVLLSNCNKLVGIIDCRQGLTAQTVVTLF